MALTCKTTFLTLATTHFESLVQFYRQVFERSPSPYIPHIYAEFQLPGLRLGIFQPNAANQAEFALSTNTTMSLCVEVADLEEAIAHLTTFGYAPAGSIKTASHGHEIYAYDPDGNRLILHQSL
jgi:predicted enzyme related to lactoylglutathione lyase